MHAYMCLCGCVSVCLFVARAMFSFFSFVYFFRKMLSRLLRRLLAPMGALGACQQGLASKSVQVRPWRLRA